MGLDEGSGVLQNVDLTLVVGPEPGERAMMSEVGGKEFVP